MPASQTQRDQLAADYGRDGYALIEAVYALSAPVWLREVPAVQVLRVVLVQNYYAHCQFSSKMKRDHGLTCGAADRVRRRIAACLIGGATGRRYRAVGCRRLVETICGVRGRALQRRRRGRGHDQYPARLLQVE